MVSLADLLDAFTPAEMFATVFAVTAVVAILNVPISLPAGMTSVFGNVAEPESLASVRVRPAAGAADEIVTVPVTDFPPFTVGGARTSALTVGAVMVKEP